MSDDVLKEQKANSKGIYLLPNLLTTTALFFGFRAIISSLNGDFEKAALSIFAAMLFDGLDGRVARLTNSQTSFGAQYDSLSDIISFGLAPSLLAYTWALAALGKAGWIASFVYTAATALRLARFNLKSETTDNHYFVGLSCTAAAGVMAGLVWVGVEFDIIGRKIPGLVWLVTILMAICMLSSINYRSFKELEFRNKVPSIFAIAALLIVALVAFDPAKILFVVFLGYACSGPFLAVKSRLLRRKSK